MSAVVLPAACADFTSTQVICSNSTGPACARADPAASVREAVPPAINISKECETEPMRMSFSVPPTHELHALDSGQQTIPQVHYHHNDVAVHARLCYRLEYLRRLPCSMIYAPS